MQYVNLGHSGLKVSRLCLGTMTFGEASQGSMMHAVGCDEPTSQAIMNRALDAGVNFFDTADVYGPDGLTERVIGNWFEKDGRRDEVVLATKFRFRMGKDANGTGASRHRIVRTVEDSLRRLKTDRIDLYQVHMQDVETPIEETLRALDDLVRAGKVLYIGASNYAAYRLMESLWKADKHGTERFVSLQTQYSLLTRDIEREHVPLCEAHGLGILPWSPLAGGLLTGKFTRDHRPEGARMTEKEGWMSSYDNETTWNTVDALIEVAKEVERSPAQVALAWLLAKPGVASVIFGARNQKQLDDNLAAAEFTLSESAMARLDEVSKPHVGYPYSFMGNIQGRW